MPPKAPRMEPAIAHDRLPPAQGGLTLMAAGAVLAAAKTAAEHLLEVCWRTKRRRVLAWLQGQSQTGC